MIYIVGISDDGLEGLSSAAVSRLREAELIVGPTLLIRQADSFSARKEAAPADLDKLAAMLNAHAGKEVVVLAGGDPLFYGTARYLCDRLGKEKFEVVPHVSSMQLAFARVKESWEEAYLASLATQPLDRVVERIRTAEKVGLFTTEQTPPSVLAQRLVDAGIDYFMIYVCENLGSKDERVTRGTASEIAKQSFGSLNVMVLVRKPGVPDKPAESLQHRLFGNPDEMFLASKPKRGLLTPSEVRAIALSEMDLRPDSIVWDVGAGSGSVAIEAASIANAGHVYAIEMDAEDFGLLVENTQRFGVRNLTPVLGQAPQAWSNLPDPDVIFVGGTGRMVADLVKAAWPRLRKAGRLVAHMGSMESVVSLQTLIQDSLGAEPQLWMIQLSRANAQLDRLRLEATNPTFLMKTTKA